MTPLCLHQIDKYCHRIGRTGRAGKTGVAITLLTEKDEEVMYDLKTYLESCEQMVPRELAKNPVAQQPWGTRNSETGKEMGRRKDTVMYAS